jgi:hypothetical protein
LLQNANVRQARAFLRLGAQEEDDDDKRSPPLGGRVFDAAAMRSPFHQQP